MKPIEPPDIDNFDLLINNHSDKSHPQGRIHRDAPHLVDGKRRGRPPGRRAFDIINNPEFEPKLPPEPGYI